MKQPNILLVVSDQERHRGWLPPSVRLPWRERLLAEGLELTNHYTHSSPCSPSRASMFTGRYLAAARRGRQRDHARAHRARPRRSRRSARSCATPATGRATSASGTCSQAVSPDMTAYGFADWEGNDRHFMGWAGTGVHFDPIIASNAASWLRANAATVPAAVVPHRRAREPARRDVVPDRPARLPAIAHPDEVASRPQGARVRRSGRTTTCCRCSPTTTTRCATSCRRTSATTCSTSPRRNGSGGGISSTACGATSIPPTRSRGCGTSTTT